MFEDFIDAFRNFSRAKTRTFLSLLGVIIGVASVIIITSLGESSTRKIRDEFGSTGLDLVSISSGFMRRSRNAVQLSFDEQFRSDLFGAVKNIRKVWFKNSASFTVSYGETSVSSSATAVEPGYLDVCGLSLDYGSYFTVTDDVFGAQKMVIGSEVASALFPDGDAVGKGVVAVSGDVPFSFRVVGVLKEQAGGMESSTTGIYVPRGFYSKKIKPNPAAETVVVQAEDKKFCSSIAEDVESFCTDRSGTEGSVYVFSMQSMIDQMSSVMGALSLMLSGIAAISLLVGGIGIMNIMIVTVTERRQEIGIRKALGASPFAICRQFLVESACITLLGGILGIGIGIAISLAIEYVVPDLQFAIDFPACAVSFAFSVLVGVFFGLSPARRASKLDPVDALA